MSESLSAALEAPRDDIDDFLKELNPEELKAFERRLFESADRSWINDRFTVEVPPHLHGEWIGVDDFSQQAAANVGFVRGDKYLKESNKLHYRPDGAAIFDVVFMVCTKQKYDAQQKHRQLQAERLSGINRNDEYTNEARRLGLEIASKSEHQTTSRILTGDELQQAIRS